MTSSFYSAMPVVKMGNCFFWSRCVFFRRRGYNTFRRGMDISFSEKESHVVFEGVNSSFSENEGHVIFEEGWLHRSDPSLRTSAADLFSDSTGCAMLWMRDVLLCCSRAFRKYLMIACLVKRDSRCQFYLVPSAHCCLKVNVLSKI